MRRPAIAFVCGIIVGIFLPSLFLRATGFVLGEDRRMYRAFAGIEPDMPRQEVVHRMGSEGRRSDKFHLSQRAGFDFEYAVASRIGAAYFLSWHTGVDITFTVAFDQNDKAIYKASGGT